MVIGRIYNNTSSSDLIPIMAHPPDKESDLSLDDFLKTVVQKKNATKGIKLDFKTIEAFNASKAILDTVRNNVCSNILVRVYL